MKQDLIAILDMGSTENARLARAVRALGVYSEIYPHDITFEELRSKENLKGIILNGGVNRIVDGMPVTEGAFVHQMQLPVLTIDHQSAYAPMEIDALPDDDQALETMLRPYLFDRCGAQANWNMMQFIDDQVEALRKQIGSQKVLLALSGGVDSSVVAALLIRAIGKQLYCVHVNHGLMRQGESEQVVEVFQNQLNAILVYVDASDRFLDKLAGVADPEQKRKIIGSEFIRVFEEEARKIANISFLAQGTIYPDIVESGTKTAKNVKSHHNVGGLPDDLQFELVEPLKYLFKDEVRACGTALGLPDQMVYRQPFPGPGLGVRCLGAITRDRLAAVRQADAILREEFEREGLSAKVWQYFTVIPDLQSVGVRNGQRADEWPVILRAVNTIDAMTAEIEEIPYAILKRLTSRITSEVPHVNRVLYDLTPKPTGTIEWE